MSQSRCDVPRTLRSEKIVVETANERRIDVSTALLTERSGACGGVLDVCEGRVDLEHIGDVLRTLGPEIVRVETANERRTDVSVALLTVGEWGVRRRT